MNSGNVKFRQGLAKMADEALGAIDLEKVEAALVVTIMTATDRNQTEPVANWLTDVQDLIHRVEEEIGKKLAWLDGKAKAATTVEKKPVARTEPARKISLQKPAEKQANNRSKIPPTITQMVQMGQQDESSAKPGHPLDEFRKVLSLPTPEKKEEMRAYWREVRNAVGDVFRMGAQLGEEDWELLFRKLKENLYTLPFEADKAFFLTADRGRVFDLLFGEKHKGDGAVNALLQTLENAERMQAVDIRSCYVILSCLEKVNDVPGNRAATEWAALIARQVVRLNGPTDLIAALEAVKVPSKTQEAAAQPRQSARRQPLPKRKFHTVHGDPDLEVDPKDLHDVHVAAKVDHKPFANLNKLVGANGKGSTSIAADSSAQ